MQLAPKDVEDGISVFEVFFFCLLFVVWFFNVPFPIFCILGHQPLPQNGLSWETGRAGLPMFSLEKTYRDKEDVEARQNRAPVSPTKFY